MKKYLAVALGIVTSIGGFLDVGSIATSADAGASFGYQLLWPLLLGTLCLIFLVEMSGRLSAVSGHPLASAMRERFGFRFFFIPLVATTLINWVVLTSEIGGICIALELATGIPFRYWALPVGFGIWLLLWFGNFGLIENGIALLGLVTVAFIAAVVVLHPSLSNLALGFVPSPPRSDPAHYWFVVVSIVGATISPYLLFFYSSGAIEDDWNKSYLGPNRLIAILGMGFGSIVSMAVLANAALILNPQNIQVNKMEQVAQLLTQPFGQVGLVLFIAALGIACLGAALEVSLAAAYVFAQGAGWHYGVDKPKAASRFTLTYTIFIVCAAALMATGIDPLQLTLLSMALTAVILPVAIAPILLLANDRDYVGKHKNRKFSNSVVVFTILVAAVIAIVAIPLEIMGGGG